MAADAAPGHPHGPGPGQQRRGGPDEEEGASRGAARPERPDAGGDPVRLELLGEAAQVKAVMIFSLVLFDVSRSNISNSFYFFLSLF